MSLLAGAIIAVTLAGTVAAAPNRVPPAGKRSAPQLTREQSRRALRRAERREKEDLLRCVRLSVTQRVSCEKAARAFYRRTVRQIRRRTAKPPVPFRASALTLRGTAQQGHTLTATRGRWSNHPTRYHYQWQSSADFRSWSNLSADRRRHRRYTVRAADVGDHLRVIVTASNAGGSQKRASSPTRKALPLPPAELSPPTISGSPQQGQTLTSSPGSWAHDPTFSYQWQTSPDGSTWSDTGSAASTHTPQAFEVERYLRVKVTASNAAGSTAAVSSHTALVTPASTRVTTSPALSPSFDPSNTDYVTRCDGTSSFQIELQTALGSTVSVDHRASQRGFFSDSVPLGFNQEFSFTLASGGSSRTYYVRCLPSDFPAYTFTKYSQPSEFGYLTTPVFGPGAEHYVIMFDNQGVPIWWDEDLVDYPVNATLMPDGTIAWMGSSGFETRYSFHRLDGTVTGQTGTVGHVTDIHELQQDSDGNYDMLAAPLVDHVDLSSIGGPSDAEVLDCIAQIVSPSGALVWSWDAVNEIPVGEFDGPSLSDYPGKVTASDGTVYYDIYHCNSMEVTPTTVLFSFRHLSAIYLVDRATKNVIWKLGGTTTPGSLTVIGDTHSIPSDGQHDARMTSGGLLSFFDDGTFSNTGPPRGVSFQIDEAAKTATYVNQVEDPTVPYSLCCGSTRILDSGNWLVGWGYSSTIGEYTAQGDPVFRLVWSPNGLFSYRTVPVPNGVYTMAEVRSGMDTMYPRP